MGDELLIDKLSGAQVEHPQPLGRRRLRVVDDRQCGGIRHGPSLNRAPCCAERQTEYVRVDGRVGRMTLRACANRRHGRPSTDSSVFARADRRIRDDNQWRHYLQDTQEEPTDAVVELRRQVVNALFAGVFGRLGRPTTTTMRTEILTEAMGA
jgi:hypothetical protein